MSTAITRPETLADLLDRLGNVPLQRIRFRPYPGTARVQDVVAALEAADKRLYELVDGVLVEKAMGFQESLLATLVIRFTWPFVEKRDLGIVLGADGALRILTRQVRIPDVCFISWDRLPGGEIPDAPVPRLAPDLAVEILSKTNTKAEMARKLRDYFQAGVRLVWYIDPKTQTAEMFTSPTASRHVNKNQSLDGGAVLPGFKLPLKTLFARARRGGKKGG